MIATTRKQLYLKARDGVNRLRRRIGYGTLSQIPKGRQGSTTECPVAKALPGFKIVPDSSDRGGYKAVSKYGGREYQLDADTSWFVKAFDNGEFSELAR